MKKVFITTILVTLCVAFAKPSINLAEQLLPEEREYLGIDSTLIFDVAKINADYLLIEIYTMYCPHCQKQAPVNDTLFSLLIADKQLAAQLKMFGIGYKNSNMEIELFREKYNVRFPLIPDPETELTGNFVTRGTPTFLLLHNTHETLVEIYRHEGKFADAKVFLDSLRANIDRHTKKRK